MRKHKNRIISILLCSFFILWICRYVALNDGLQINDQFEHIYHDLGEKVAFGDNMCLGMQYYTDLAISVDAIEVIDTNVYIEQLGKSEEDFFFLLPEKVIEATITIYNDHTEEQGIYFSSLQVVGSDWYQYYHHELTAYANDLFKDNVGNAFGIILLPEDEYTIKLVFTLFKQGFPEHRWQNLEKEEMYMQTTIRPEAHFIKLQ